MLLRAPTCIAISGKIEIKKAFCKAISRQVLHPKSQGRLHWEIWKLNTVNIPSCVAQRLQPFLFPKIKATSQKCFLSHGWPKQVKQPQGLRNSSRVWGQLGSQERLRPRDLGPQIWSPGTPIACKRPLWSFKCHQAPGDTVFWRRKGKQE